MDLNEALDALTTGRASPPARQEEALRSLAAAIAYYHHGNSSDGAYNRIRVTLMSKGNSVSITKRHMAVITGWHKILASSFEADDQEGIIAFVLKSWSMRGISSVRGAYYTVRDPKVVYSETDQWFIKIERELSARLQAASADQLWRFKNLVDAEIGRRQGNQPEPSSR